jgi:hypothetical protein
MQEDEAEQAQQQQQQQQRMFNPPLVHAIDAPETDDVPARWGRQAGRRDGRPGGPAGGCAERRAPSGALRVGRLQPRPRAGRC